MEEEDNLKNEDEPKNKDNLKNENNTKNEDNSKLTLLFVGALSEVIKNKCCLCCLVKLSYFGNERVKYLSIKKEAKHVWKTPNRLDLRPDKKIEYQIFLRNAVPNPTLGSNLGIFK